MRSRFDQATLKKKFVSCPAGGHTSGQSGGRKMFFSFYYFFSLYRNGRKNAGEKKEKIGKICSHGTNKLTRAVDRKPNYF